MAVEVYMVGHPTRRIEEFLRVLHTHGVREIVDVRTVPKSRTNPQFGSDALRRSLTADGIADRHLPSLIGDAVLVRGIPVLDLMNEHTAKPHQLTRFARVEGDRISYPAADEHDSGVKAG